MTQDEATTEEKSSRSYWAWLIWPVVGVLVYALSAGPALLLVQKRWMSRNVLVAYAPLEEIIRGNFLERPMRVYLHFWVPGMYDFHGDEI